MEKPSTYLSTKGQVVIPKVVRDAARLEPGSQLEVAFEQGRIILTPIVRAKCEELYGRFCGSDLLGDLARDREAEIGGEVVLKDGNKQHHS